MNTEDFHFFIRVAELGSISKAAKEANIAVSVASQKIQRLENTLSLRLFYRTTRKLTLTEQGEKLLNDGRLYIESFETLTTDLKSKDHQLTGRIHVTASATFGMYRLTKIIADFLKIHPNLEIDLDLNDQNIDLIEHNIDVAIRIGKLEDSTLIAKKILDNPRLLCASPEYIAQFGEPKSLEELKQHKCIIQRHHHGLSDTWNFLDISNDIIKLKVNGQFICNSGEGIRQAVIAGLGISNHSFWHIEQDLKDGKLIQILENHTVEPTAIYAVIPHRKLVPHKVKAFIDYLIHNIRTDF